MSFTSVVQAFWSTFDISSEEVSYNGMIAKVFVCLSKDRCRIVDLLILRQPVWWEAKKTDVFLPTILVCQDVEYRSYTSFDEWEVVHYPSLGNINYEASLQKYFTGLIAKLKEELPSEPDRETDFEVKFCVHGYPRIVDFKSATFSDGKEKCKVQF